MLHLAVNKIEPSISSLGKGENKQCEYMAYNLSYINNLNCFGDQKKGNSKHLSSVPQDAKAELL